MSQAQIALRDVGEGRNQVALQVGAAELGIEPEELELAGDLSIALEIYREGYALQIRGNISGTADAVCSRCATRFRSPFEAELFLIARYAPGGVDPGDFGDDESMICHDGHALDLSDSIRQLVVLAQPMAPICREDCRGLCPHCGADLNRETCGCQHSAPDPRWRIIDDLLRKSGPQAGS